MYAPAFECDEGLPETAVLGLGAALMGKGMMEYVMRQEQGYLLRRAPEDFRQEWERLQQLTREREALTRAPFVTEEQLDTSQKKLDDIQTDLWNRYPERFRAIQLPQVTVEDLARVLEAQDPNNAALLEYIRYARFSSGKDRLDLGAEDVEHRYGVFLLLSGSRQPVVVRLPTPAEEVDAAVAAYREAVATQDEAHVRKAGKELREMVLDPVLSRLGGRTRLFIAPDAQLFTVPFESFPVPEDAGDANRYLVQKYEIIYLDAARDLVQLALMEGVETPKNEAIIVAGPNFDLPAAAKADRICKTLGKLAQGEHIAGLFRETSEEGVPIAGRTPVPEGETALKLSAGDLPDPIIGEAPDFAAQVISVLNGTGACNSIVDWSFDDALEWNLRNIHGPRILQVLTHGRFATSQNKDAAFEEPLKRSMLKCTGSNSKTPARVFRVGKEYLTESMLEDMGTKLDDAELVAEDDGKLTAYEVSGMDLWGTDLVALTACESALGEAQAGRSIAGLRRAFKIAGARALIIAQWEIPTQESIDLMTAFYRGWFEDRLAPYAAFRAAQLEIMKSNPHPRSWAGMVYVGAPGKDEPH